MGDDDRIREALRRAVGRMESELFTSTSSAEPAETLTPDMLKDMLDRFEKMRREFRRNDLTVTVDLSHEGPMVSHKHPTDGTIVECSPAQAQELHQHVPLKLIEVVSEHQARFGIATQFDGSVPRLLPLPPYEMPEDPSADQIGQVKG